MSLAAFIPIIGPAIQKILDLIPDKNARAKAEMEFQRDAMELIAKESEGQRETNKIEAAHSSIFVAGWRPFIGWVCGLALAYQYLVRPFWVWVGAVWQPDAPIPPGLDEALWELMFGMLGLGGLRSVEKFKGVAR